MDNELIKNITQAELEQALEKATLVNKHKGKAPRLCFQNHNWLYSKDALLKIALREIIDNILAERRAYIENYEGDGNGFENF